jgi:hypothetical protein
MKNIDLFFECLKYPEMYIEKAYQKELLIITKDKREINTLIEANNEIIEKITAYKVAFEYKNNTLCDDIIERIIFLLNTNEINNTEFTNYWGVHDISYSIYNKFPYSEKFIFIKNMLDLYIENRHHIYQSHGYSSSSLQVRCDSIAHKRSGSLWSIKVESILKKYGIPDIHTLSFLDFLSADIWYVLADGTGSFIFDQLIQSKIIDFYWWQKHQWKRPDFVIKHSWKLFIMEHKHMKEWWGGQNKQIVEVIDFIGQNESNIHYITFLDGPYFNKFSWEMDKKESDQFKQIQENLINSPNNYFVNTYGFEYLLSS